MGNDEWARYKRQQAAGWLRRVRDLARLESELAALADAEADRMGGLGAVRYDRPGVQSQPAGDSFADAIQRHIDTVESLRSIAAEASRRMSEAAAAVAGLDDPLEAAVLACRWLEGLGWRETARRLSYSEQHLKRVQAGALEHLYDAMPPSERDPLPRAL